jgi:hypothetical protein
MRTRQPECADAKAATEKGLARPDQRSHQQLLFCETKNRAWRQPKAHSAKFHRSGTSLEQIPSSAGFASLFSYLLTQ